jgi:hypothetical protein
VKDVRASAVVIEFVEGERSNALLVERVLVIFGRRKNLRDRRAF